MAAGRVSENTPLDVLFKRARERLETTLVVPLVTRGKMTADQMLGQPVGLLGG